jgi:hypothetical protein
LKFVGDERRRVESSVAQRQAGSPGSSAPERGSARNGRRVRLGLIVRPIRRRTSERRLRSELVSQPWSPSDELELEIDRSRRFGRHFGLVRISRCRQFEDRWMPVRELAYALCSLLRRVDRVWIEGPRVYVLLPECDRTMVEAMLVRIHEPLERLLGEGAGGHSEVSAAAFPEDGLTSGALYAALGTDRPDPRSPERRGAPAE